MKPEIPNIIFKSLLWLKKNNYQVECQYLIQKYKLTGEQQRIYDTLNQEDVYGVVESKQYTD